MPRAQNAHACVNAGFLFRLNVNNGGKVLSKPTIVYGGINPQFVSMMMMMMMMMMMIMSTTVIIISHVECESISDTSNKRGDWNHPKITQKIPEQPTRKA
jgi:hypothetical protein